MTRTPFPEGSLGSLGKDPMPSTSRTVGYGILGLTLLTILCAVVLALHERSARQPHVYYRGFGIKDPGPGDWPHLHEMIDAIHEVLAREHPTVDAALTDNLWIVLVPEDQKVTSVSAPTGMVADPEHPEVPLHVMGTIDEVRSGIFGFGHIIQEVVVHRYPGGACETDVVAHEVAEHLTPIELGEGANVRHDPKWKPLTREIYMACLSRIAGATTATVTAPGIPAPGVEHP